MSEAGIAPKPRRRRHWIIGGALALALAIAVARLLWPDPCAGLEPLKNVAVAQLESAAMVPKKPDRLAEADATFVELGKRLPHDPLGPRNLVIARLMAMDREGLTPEQARTALERAYAAVQALLAVDDGSAAAHLLAARFAMRAGDEAQAQAEWQRATELAGDDASVWYEFYKLSEASQDPAIQRRGREAPAGSTQRAVPST